MKATQNAIVRGRHDRCPSGAQQSYFSEDRLVLSAIKM